MKYFYLFIVSGFFLFTYTSCDKIIGVKDISKSYISIIAPVHNSEVYSGSVTFSWNAVSDATKYQLQIGTPSFVNAVQIITDTLLVNTSCVVGLTEGEYEWRVKAINSEYETSYQTQILKVLKKEIPSKE